MESLKFLLSTKILNQKKIDTVVISTQHSPDISLSQLREEIIDKVIRLVVAVGLIIKPNFLLIRQEGL